MARKTVTIFICNRCKREVTQPSEPTPRDGWWEVYIRNSAVSGGAPSPSFYADLCPICVGELEKFMRDAVLAWREDASGSEWVCCDRNLQAHLRDRSCPGPRLVPAPQVKGAST